MAMLVCPGVSSGEIILDDLQTIALNGFKIEKKEIIAPIKLEVYNGTRNRF